MANFFEGVGNLLMHPINEAKWIWEEGIEDVGKNLIRGNFSEAWDEVKDLPGSHQRMMNNITVPIFGDNKLSKNSDALAGAAVASVFAAPYVASAFGSGAGAGGGKGGKIPGLGGSDFATGNFGGGNFGNADFGGSSFPDFSGGMPNTDTGWKPGWQGGAEFGDFLPTDYEGLKEMGVGGKETPWGDIISEGLKAIQFKEHPQVSSPAHRPGFKGVQIPAMQYDAGAIQEKMAAQEFASLAQPQAPINGDLNSLLKSFQ